MKKRSNWIADLLNQTIEDVKKWRMTDENQVKENLEWFKHERMIHLIVTVFVWLFLAILLISNNNSMFMVFLTFVMLILEGCYLYHYSRLENWVQKLNQLYLKLISRKSKGK